MSTAACTERSNVDTSVSTSKLQMYPLLHQLFRNMPCIGVMDAVSFIVFPTWEALFLSHRNPFYFLRTSARLISSSWACEPFYRRQVCYCIQSSFRMISLCYCLFFVCEFLGSQKGKCARIAFSRQPTSSSPRIGAGRHGTNEGIPDEHSRHKLRRHLYLYRLQSETASQLTAFRRPFADVRHPGYVLPLRPAAGGGTSRGGR